MCLTCGTTSVFHIQVHIYAAFIQIKPPLVGDHSLSLTEYICESALDTKRFNSFYMIDTVTMESLMYSCVVFCFIPNNPLHVGFRTWLIFPTIKSQDHRSKLKVKSRKTNTDNFSFMNYMVENIPLNI